MSAKWTDLGCWIDNYDRAISGSYSGTPTVPSTVQQCYDRAVSNGHDIFALQAGFACFTGKESVDNYNKHGASTGPCYELGDGWVNHVYKVNPVTQAPVVPHAIGEYSSWVPISGVFSDFRTQSTNLLNSLTTDAAATNPAPYMTALDTNINAIRDAVKIKQLQALNAQNIQTATDLVEDVTDMSDTLKKNRDQAQLLKQQISLSTNKTEEYKKKLLPLQILAATLAIVLVVYILIGAVLPTNVSSIIALVLLAGGFGAAVYFAVVNKQN